MEIFNETVWVIMTKDRKMIAKGVPRSRYLVPVDNEKDKKRILTYGSKGKAEAGFKTSWFYSAYNFNTEDLEAVEVKMAMTEVK